MLVKMSPFQYRKELPKNFTKYHKSMDKENAYTIVQNGKSSECKPDSGKKKGLSLNAECRAVSTISLQKSSVGKTPFEVYFDSNENVRSRPRVRKDVCRKEIRARRDVEALEKTTVMMTKVVEADDFNLRNISRRARSSSNCRNKVSLDKTIEANNKLFHNRGRSCSESRKQLPRCVVQSSDVQRTRHLTDDVKKRTFCSIEMWKDKMRKPCNGTVPKNFTNIYSNVLSIDKTHGKTKLQRNSTNSVDLQSKILQNDKINPDKNIDKQLLTDNNLTSILKHLSHEIAAILEDKTYLNTQTDDTKSLSSKNNNLDITVTSNDKSNIVTPLDGHSALPLTPVKVRYEKREVTWKSSTKKDMNEFDVVNETLCDYLGDVPDTERKRDDNAPKLSSRFLRDNVNAEQRRLIVGYIIRLGVHCYYPSHVIYQTIKLFNVAIDRILVKTDDIQLMALACLWIALKRAGSSEKLPSATVILQLAKDLYINQKKHLLMYEKKIFEAVKFNIQFADPFSLLSYYILNINEDSQHKVITSNNIVHLYFCGSYMIDLSMLDEELCDVSVHVIAMAATELALCLVYSSDIINESWCSVWRRKQLLTEWEERVMISTKQSMLLNATQHWKFSSNVIYKKYMRSRNGRITILVHDKLRNIIC